MAVQSPKPPGINNRDAVLKEIIKCGKDPVYFIKRYAKIQHPRKGLISFETYPFQDTCISKFENHRFNIVLKSRQLGLSTVTAAYATWYALFKKDKNILVIATKLKTAMNFIKKCKVIIDNVPSWLLLTTPEPTKQSIRFSNGSVITAIPTSSDAGRSEALSLLIVDECVVGNSKIRVRDSQTNSEFDVTIEQLYTMLKDDEASKDTTFMCVDDASLNDDEGD